MWRNYLTVGYRSLTRSRAFAFINIFGLALGLAACLLLLLYVRYETSYDAWLPDAEHVFQVQTVVTDPETGDRREQQSAPRPTAEALAKDFPQIEYVSKAEGGRVTILSDGEAQAADVLMVDEPFFQILPVPFLKGDPVTAMRAADSLAVSRDEAMKRFGTIDAVGRTVDIIGDAGPRALKVTGVFENLPKNSHLDFAMVGKFKEEWPCGWGCTTGAAYLKLKPGADADAINAGLAAWEKRNIPNGGAGSAQTSEGANQDWRLVNVADVHLSGAEGERPGNDRQTLATFSVIALLILFMATVNFTNLATARAGQRAREVALRKVLGARRRQLVAQFLGESILLTAVAMLLSLALVELLLPFFSAFLDADLRFDYVGTGGILLPALLLVFVVGAAGGAYPALYLSRFQPAAVLKANRSASETPGSGRVRTTLVVAQFAISISLIVCTVIVYHQTLFATRSSAGFDRQGLIQLDSLHRPGVAEQREALFREIERIEGVTAAAGTSIVPASDQTLYTNVAVPGKSEPEKIGWYSVEPDFFGTMRIPMLAGRPLQERFARDKAYVPGVSWDGDEALAERTAREIVGRGLNVVLNKAAAERLGYRDPAQAIGKQFPLELFGEELGAAPATIVGVAANSRFRSLREQIEPTIYYDTGEYRRLAIRYDDVDPATVMASIERVWKRLAPQVPIDAAFSDDKMASQYLTDARRGQTFAGFALLAILIACLGLFGLAAFTAERRTKEIGIRKVFGARIRDIVRLLAWQFSKPVVAANLIAWPVAWWVMRDWLNGFDARIALTPGPFVLAGGLALAIALGTISGHAIKVARTNPIHALRYE
jgi:putative ABC transport system permease protein